jgi:hypothetical protein
MGCVAGALESALIRISVFQSISKWLDLCIRSTYLCIVLYIIVNYSLSLVRTLWLSRESYRAHSRRVTVPISEAWMQTKTWNSGLCGFSEQQPASSPLMSWALGSLQAFPNVRNGRRCWCSIESVHSYSCLTPHPHPRRPDRASTWLFTLACVRIDMPFVTQEWTLVTLNVLPRGTINRSFLSNHNLEDVYFDM